MANVNVRYIVSNVDEAIPFYERLGFKVAMHPAPGFARLTRGDLSLLLNQPAAGGAGQSSNAGEQPSPGGWNRFQLEVDDLDAMMAEMRAAGSAVRTDIVQGNGGRSPGVTRITYPRPPAAKPPKPLSSPSGSGQLTLSAAAASSRRKTSVWPGPPRPCPSAPSSSSRRPWGAVTSRSARS